MSKKELRITLKSDLCVGSGYSYAGVIDSDVCYDELGIPYIPAKRLKGVLRECAELICIPESDIEKIFGTNGKAIYGDCGEYAYTGIRISNAYIPDYKRVYHSLQGLEKKYPEYVTPQSVLEQFTVIKAQTKIESYSGTAEDNSLRFTRAVKHYSPLDDAKEMEFVAEVELIGLDDGDVEILGKIAKAVRNIGLNRNRGMGSVRCVLRDGIDTNEQKVDLKQIYDDEEMYQLSYCIRNTAPLVLNAENNYKTERYIHGQSVLGYFASAYLRSGKKADEDFSNLFLRNKVIFGGLYPSEGERIFYPAPSYIKCLKRTRKYVDASNDNLYKEDIELDTNMVPQNDDPKDYSIANGNIPKKLKGKFVYINESKADNSNHPMKKNTSNLKIQVKEVETDIVYHHTKKSDRQESVDGELLYSFETIRAQQTFSGAIVGKGKYLRILGALLNAEKLQFGKSKNSQYGTCILDGKPRISKIDNKKRIYGKGSKILVTLQSDGIFMNKNGYTVQCEEVRTAIEKALTKYELKEETKQIDNKDKDEKKWKPYSELTTRKLVGFYSKWNLKRQAIPVVCAGSSFEFDLTKSIAVGEEGLYVGERNGEGYGKLSIIVKNNGNYCLSELLKVESDPIKLSAATSLCKKILVKQMKERLAGAAYETTVEIKNSSTVGRIKLMLTESINKYPNDMAEAYRCFNQKVQNIKDKDKKETITAIKEELICKGEFKYEKLCYRNNEEIQKLIKAYKEIQEIEKLEELEREVENMWSDYFMNYLVHEEYRKRGSLNNGRE